MTTAREIVTEALGEAGILDPASPVSAEDAEFARGKLNTIVDAWGADSSLSFTTTTTVFDLPPGTASRTIGPGQEIDVALPQRLEDSSFIRIGSIDYQLKIIDEETYNAIGIKSIAAPWPAWMYFDGGFPVGNVFFWPLGGGEVHLVTNSMISAFADWNTDYPLPPGYRDALIYTLAERLLRPHGKPADPLLARDARNARRAIRRIVVPQLDNGGPYISDRARLFGLPF